MRVARGLRCGWNSFDNLWTSPKLEDIELATGPAPMEIPMEPRIARIEADVAHLRSDVADIKVDMRARFDRMDARMDRLESKIDSRTDELRKSVDGVKDRLASAQVWALVLYFALAG